VHRDLACRNVYLSYEKTCKISEYGLIRDIYAENVYRKTTGVSLYSIYMCTFFVNKRFFVNKIMRIVKSLDQMIDALIY